MCLSYLVFGFTVSRVIVSCDLDGDIFDVQP